MPLILTAEAARTLTKESVIDKTLKEIAALEVSDPATFALFDIIAKRIENAIELGKPFVYVCCKPDVAAKSSEWMPRREIARVKLIRLGYNAGITGDDLQISWEKA